MGRPRDPFSPVLAHPDATESAVTVTPGGFQLESGYTFGRVEGVSIHTAGEVLLRIGDFDRMEVRLGAYFEHFGVYPIIKDGPDGSFLNGGVTFLVLNDLQLDARAGFGLNGLEDDFFIGLGSGVRW
jgi:hypothetical protein